MKSKIPVFIFVLTLIVKYSDGYSQNILNTRGKENIVLDSLSVKGFIFKTIRQKPDIMLNKDQALGYLRNWYKSNNWNNPGDPLRRAIGQLIYFASNGSFDSTKYFFDRYSYDSIIVQWDKFYVWDTLKVKVPVISPLEFPMPSNPLTKVDTVLKKNISDTIKSGITTRNSNFLSQTGIPVARLKDTIILVARDTLYEVTSPANGFPFRHYKWPYEGDSIKTAINSLINYVEGKDSTIVNLSGSSKKNTPFWFNSKGQRLVRFWLRNEYSDSVTVWIGSLSRNTIGLYLEEGILFRRPTKQFNISDAQLNIKQINSATLQDVNKAYIKPQYWKFRAESSFVLNQTSLTNWVKGGESSIATSMDITGYADYNNKQANLLSGNFARLNYGYVASGQEGIRKNIDLLETNSKFNHKAFGKFDFSAILLFKTQIAKGFTYTDTSKTLVSKFLNPAVVTIGLGIDFKPDKTTSVNFSPLSYKATFVTDTVHIDQTQYGIPKNKKSLQEPGASLLISNEFKPAKTIDIINRLQLFTNYIHNPQNIDVDWEMIATAKLNWFTDIRFNTHLIYDDKTKTPVFYENGKPVLEGNGIQKKTARIQFKELLGFSLVFRF